MQLIDAVEVEFIDGWLADYVGIRKLYSSFDELKINWPFHSMTNDV